MDFQSYSPRASYHRFFRLYALFGIFSYIAFGKDYYSNRDERSCVCRNDFDPTIDYFPNKVKPDFSNDAWNVEYFNSYKKLAIGNDLFYLYLCGTTAPEVQENDTLVEIPIKNAGLSSSTVVSLFEFLGQRTSLSGYFGDAPLPFVSPCMQKAGKDGLIVPFKKNLPTTPIEVLFGSPFTNVLGTVAENLTLIRIANDKSSLFGLLEWVEVVAMFFNRELAAAEIWNSVTERYNCTKAIVEKAQIIDKKSVFAVYFNIYSENGAESSCSTKEAFSTRKAYAIGCEIDDFVHPLCQVISDAGGQYISFMNGDDSEYKRSSSLGTYELTLAQLKNIVESNTVDAIYHFSFYYEVCAGRFEEIFGDSNAWINGNLFDNMRTVVDFGNYVGTSWFEQKDAEPDVLLLDFIESLGIDDVNHNRKFLRRVIDSRPSSKFSYTKERSFHAISTQCENVNAPLYTGWKETPCAATSNDATIDGLNVLNNEDVCTSAARCLYQSGILAMFMIWANNILQR